MVSHRIRTHLSVDTMFEPEAESGPWVCRAGLPACRPSGLAASPPTVSGTGTVACHQGQSPSSQQCWMATAPGGPGPQLTCPKVLPPFASTSTSTSTAWSSPSSGSKDPCRSPQLPHLAWQEALGDLRAARGQTALWDVVSFRVMECVF